MFDKRNIEFILVVLGALVAAAEVFRSNCECPEKEEKKKEE